MADEPVTEPTTQEPTTPTTPAEPTGTTILTQDQKPTEEPKVEEPKAEEPAAPLTREDLVLPEGFSLSDEQATSFLELVNDTELSAADRSNKLIELHSNLMRDFAESTVAEITKQQEEWENEIKNDPAIGGDKLAPTLAKISKFIDAEGTPELRQALDATGAGSNPTIVRFFAKLAENYTEGSVAAGGNPTTDKSTAQRMYPNMNP